MDAPRLHGVHLLWCHDFVDAPLSGVARVGDATVWFACTNYDEEVRWQDGQAETCPVRRYRAWRLTPEQLGIEEADHSAAEANFAARLANDPAWHPLAVREVDYSANPVVGDFTLDDLVR